MPTVSYGAKLIGNRRFLELTAKIYRKAVSYILGIALKHYDELALITDSPDGFPAQKLRKSAVESLIHSTKSNKAKYEKFDQEFYKFPSYFRRDAIAAGIGKAFSYRSMVDNWENNGKKGQKPSLNTRQDVAPCFYRTVMFAQDGLSISLKVYNGSDWVWADYRTRKTDYDYAQKNVYDWKASAPVLVRKHGYYQLRTTYVLSSEHFPKYIKDKDVSVAVGVDLGVNTDAVCSALSIDGTVIGQKFVNSPVEKDRMYGLLNCIKKAQQHGNRKNHRLWRFVNNYQRAIAIRTACGIIDFALKTGAKVIVFENLSFKGKKRGCKSRRQRLALWRKRDIQHRVEEMGKQLGIRVSYICAKYTSQLAFDGSGKVVRGKNAGFKNDKLCRFTDGRVYNCDLSASKNIGARYFIRVLLKSIPAKELLQFQAKVPEICRRTRSTLASLISLYQEMYPICAAVDVA